jgi:hypothetical protein
MLSVIMSIGAIGRRVIVRKQITGMDRVGMIKMIAGGISTSRMRR